MERKDQVVPEVRSKQLLYVGGFFPAGTFSQYKNNMLYLYETFSVKLVNGSTVVFVFSVW